VPRRHARVDAALALDLHDGTVRAVFGEAPAGAEEGDDGRRAVERRPRAAGRGTQDAGRAARVYNPSVSARSFVRPVARLFRMKASRPMKSTSRSPKARLTRSGHASAKVRPVSSVRMSMRPGGRPI